MSLHDYVCKYRKRHKFSLMTFPVPIFAMRKRRIFPAKVVCISWKAMPLCYYSSPALYLATIFCILSIGLSRSLMEQSWFSVSIK